MSTQQILRKVDFTWRGGGFTVDLEGRSPSREVDTYVVSLVGCEWRSPAAPTGHELESYILDHYTLLSQPNRYLGGWTDNREYVLDVSEVVHGREVAVKLALARHQDAVFDLFTGTCIYVRAEPPAPIPHDRTRRSRQATCRALDVPSEGAAAAITLP